MTDEINFMCAVCIPQVDREDKKGAIDFARSATAVRRIGSKRNSRKA
jgi:hypothetical protein